MIVLKGGMAALQCFQLRRCVRGGGSSLLALLLEGVTPSPGLCSLLCQLALPCLLKIQQPRLPLVLQGIEPLFASGEGIGKFSA